MALRAQLAVNGARQALDRPLARTTARGLRDAARRDHARRAHHGRGGLLAARRAARRDRRLSRPSSRCRVGCSARMRTEAPRRDVVVDDRRELPGGRVHVSAIPCSTATEPLGFVVLVHDLSFVERREATTRSFLLLAFGFLALRRGAVTRDRGALLLARLERRAAPALLRGDASGPSSSRSCATCASWSSGSSPSRSASARAAPGRPSGCKQTLQPLPARREVVIVANREPYIHERTTDGAIAVLHPASGLVTALEPVMRACSGVWVAHGSGIGRPRDGRRARTASRVPPGEESYLLRRVWLTAGGREGLLLRLLQRGPLAALPHRPRAARSSAPRTGSTTRRVNQKFADAVCEEVDSRRPDRPRAGLSLRARARS